MLHLDHLAFAAGSLGQGVAAVEAALGVTLAPGGAHPAMGTHNRLLSLGPGEYLEVIAVNPQAPAPDRPRWFDLDRFAGPPRVTNWIVRCDDLAAAVATAPTGTGVPMPLTRGDLSWTMAVPVNGRLPFDGGFPALIQWFGAAHPAQRLPDVGVRLTALHLTHPEADALRAALPLSDTRVTVSAGPIGLRATFSTPKGLRVL
ncbi:MAG: VOC family protein [Gemmobacter sp.]|nr:VOC family protein [Gemmobacter sp.]